MMKTHSLFPLLVVLLAAATLGADLPTIPADPIAKKKELLFSDDFERAELGPAWGQVVPTFTLENGSLKGTQRRVNAPAANGKPAVVGHQAVIGTDVPTKDSIVEFKFKLAGATAVSAEFDDRKYKGSHYGHICFVRVTPKSVILADQRDGSMRNDIYAMTDPSQKEERNKLLAGRSATFPVKVESDQWHTLLPGNRRRQDARQPRRKTGRIPPVIRHRPPHQVQNRIRLRRQGRLLRRRQNLERGAGYAIAQSHAERRDAEKERDVTVTRFQLCLSVHFAAPLRLCVS